MGEKPFAQFQPSAATLALEIPRFVWMWWLKHVVEREMEQDPGLQLELTNESRRVRTKLLE